jgi:hypothetical protein
METASRKVNAAQVSVVAAMRVYGEVWRSQHKQANQSLQRQLEAGDAPLVSRFARAVGG